MAWTWGSERAILDVVEFTDLACGFCARFHAESYPTLFVEYVETGKVRWTLVPFASGRFPRSLDATLFAVCAVEQGKSPASIRDLLFDRQETWMSGETGDAFAAYAAELSMDLEAYRSCATRRDVLDRLAENDRRAREAGVRATPTLLVDGFPVMGALPLEIYRQMLDRAIEGITGTGDASSR